MTARQPKGIPAGGQFAPDHRAEPTVSLATTPAFGPGARVVAGRKSGTVAGSPNPDGTVRVNLDGGGCIVVSPVLLEREQPSHRSRHPEWTEIAKELAAQSGASEREARPPSPTARPSPWAGPTPRAPRLCSTRATRPGPPSPRSPSGP